MFKKALEKIKKRLANRRIKNLFVPTAFAVVLLAGFFLPCFGSATAQAQSISATANKYNIANTSESLATVVGGITKASKRDIATVADDSNANVSESLATASEYSFHNAQLSADKQNQIKAPKGKTKKVKDAKQIGINKNDFKDIKVVLRFQGKSWTYNYAVPLSIPNIHTILEQASTQLGYANKVRAMLKYSHEGYSKETAVLQVLDGFSSFLRTIENQIYIKPINASANFYPQSPNKFIYAADTDGRILDRAKLFQSLYSELQESNFVEIPVYTHSVEADISLSEIKNNTQKRGGFSTSFATSTYERGHNISLALSKLNGQVVMPGYTLSFNKIVGARTTSRGFKEAKIILNGKFEDGVGGGVCQVSTTLYNAWLLSNLEVDSYQAHSLPVSYVPLSFDATVSSGIDLVLKNNTQYPLYISAYTKNSRAFVEIFGSPLPEGLQVKRRSIVTGSIKASDEIEVDAEAKYPDLYLGETRRIKDAKDGIKSEGYLDYYLNGVKINSERLRKDVYKPQKGLIVQGTIPKIVTNTAVTNCTSNL